MEPSIISPIIPDKGNFKYQLVKGASQLSTYDRKFEVYVDMQDYERENVRIKITRDGIINLRILSDGSDPKNKEPEILYDENIIIPKHEKVRRKSITCQINGNGILKISGIPDQENLINLSQSNSETGGEFKNQFRHNSAMFIIIRPRIFASTVKTRNEREVSTPWGQIRMGSTITQAAQAITPPQSVDEKFEANVLADDYSPDELQIIIRGNWLTITGKKKSSLFEENPAHQKTFTKKFQFPETIKPESIVCGQDPISGMIYITNDTAAA